MTRFIKLTETDGLPCWIASNTITTMRCGYEETILTLHGDSKSIAVKESPDRIFLLCDEAAMAELEGAE